MTQQELVWCTAICPICKKKYAYVKTRKPKTCNSFGCVHESLHPELKKGNNGIKY